MRHAFDAHSIRSSFGQRTTTAAAWCALELTGERRYVDAVALYGEVGPDVARNIWPELSAFVESTGARRAG